MRYNTNGRLVTNFEFYELALQEMAEIDKTELDFLYTSWINQLNRSDIVNDNRRKNIMWRNFSESNKWKTYVNLEEYNNTWDETNTNNLLTFVKTKIDEYYQSIIRKGLRDMQNRVNEKCKDYRPKLNHYCNVDNGNGNGNAGGSKPRKTKRHKSRKTKHHKSRKTKRHKSRKTKRRSKRKRV